MSASFNDPYLQFTDGTSAEVISHVYGGGATVDPIGKMTHSSTEGITTHPGTGLSLPTFSFGGYSNDLNIGTVLKIGKKKNSFLLGTDNLEDIMNGENAKALSFMLQFIKQF